MTNPVMMTVVTSKLKMRRNRDKWLREMKEFGRFYTRDQKQQLSRDPKQRT